MTNPNRVFGQTMRKQSRYQRQFGGNRADNVVQNDRDNKAEEAAARRRLRQEQGENIDVKFGYRRLEDETLNSSSGVSTIQRRGWLFHMLATTVSCFGMFSFLNSRNIAQFI